MKRIAVGDRNWGEVVNENFAELNRRVARLYALVGVLFALLFSLMLVLLAGAR